MSEFDLVIRARRSITAGGEVASYIGITGGRITSIMPYDTGDTGDTKDTYDTDDTESGAARIVDLDDDVVLLPGLVDTHVHVNEPGRTEWEGFASATRAAAAGGITTILDMPLNSIPATVNAAALEVKKGSAASQAYIDVGFWGGAIPGNLHDLRGLHDAGVFGFKCFLLPSGVPEFPPLSPQQLPDYLRELNTFGALMIVHAEDEGTIEHAPAPRGRSYDSFVTSRPAEAENIAIAGVIEAARSTGARVHVLHLSSAGALPMIRAARREGLRITVETCPHYLVFDAEGVPDGDTRYKCCPPIRDAENRELLWQALAAGDIDYIVSDHSPCTPELKQLDLGDFDTAWGGIASLQIALPAVWTEARRRGFPLARVIGWMAQRPAEVAGLQHKGRLEVGYDADFCVFAPNEEFMVDPAHLRHKNRITPYAGRTLTGVVRSTWLRGCELTGEHIDGQLLNSKRSPA
jgi:allantoinase